MLLIEGLRSLQRPTYLQTPMGGHHHQLRSLDLVGQLTTPGRPWLEDPFWGYFNTIVMGMKTGQVPKRKIFVQRPASRDYSSIGRECLSSGCCKVKLNVSLTFMQLLKNRSDPIRFIKFLAFMQLLKNRCQLGLSNRGMTLDRVKILFQKPELHRNNYHWRQKFRWSHHQLSNSPEAESYKMISDAMVETEISQK